MEDPAEAVANAPNRIVQSCKRIVRDMGFSRVHNVRTRSSMAATLPLTSLPNFQHATRAGLASKLRWPSFAGGFETERKPIAVDLVNRLMNFALVGSVAHDDVELPGRLGEVELVGAALAVAAVLKVVIGAANGQLDLLELLGRRGLAIVVHGDRVPD